MSLIFFREIKTAEQKFRMVAAYEDVFTFHKSELLRFENFLMENLENV
ncbi:hypothetical protein IT568_12855 [bacterium]|nr:hypothetical protein [bacterium]